MRGGHQAGMYIELGHWRININTDATNEIDSYAVELSLGANISLEMANQIISKANSISQSSQLGAFYDQVPKGDNDLLLQNAEGTTLLTSDGDNGSYIPLAFYKRTRPKNDAKFEQILEIVNHAIIVVSFLELLYTNV